MLIKLSIFLIKTNDNFRVDRDMDKDLGGYIQVIEFLEELKSLKEDKFIYGL